MTLISDRLNRARVLHNVDSYEYEDTNALIDINVLIREAILMRKTNWDRATSNLVLDQDEYRVDIISWTPDLEIINIDKVEVNSGSGFKKATPISYYEVNENTIASKTSPIFYSKDNSVFILPIPDENVTSGFKIEYTYTPADIALTDNDSDIKLPKQIVDVIFDEWLAYYIEMGKRNKWDAKNLQLAYKQRLSRINWMLGGKIRQPRPNNLPQDITTLI